MGHKVLLRELYRNLVLAVLTLAVLVSVTVAWIAKNTRLGNNGMRMEIDDPDQILILDSIEATRTYLGGSDDNLSFTRSSDGTLLNGSGENVNAIFDNMLPGENVDITFRVYMDDIFDGKHFQVYFEDYVVDEKPTSLAAAYSSNCWFAIEYQEVLNYYSVLGVYNHSLVSMMAHTAGGDVEIGGSQLGVEEYFVGYTAGSDSVIPTDKEVVCKGVWDDSYEYIEITIRVAEDFSQFYQLIMETGSNNSNLLSEKGFAINVMGVGLDSAEENNEQD